MKKLILGLFVCLLTQISIGQIKLINDTLYLNDSVKLVKGKDLHFGEGSNMATREFNFITTAPSPFIHTMNLPANMAGSKMIIYGFKVQKSKKTGNKYFVILSGGNIIKYWCDIIPAIRLKEVIINLDK